MTTLNQEGQNVHGPETNIGGDVGQVKVGTASDQAGLVAELERLKSELPALPSGERSGRTWPPIPSTR